MTIKRVQTTIAHKKSEDVVTEVIYMVRDVNGFPIAKVTMRDRLMTFEAVGASTFSMNEQAQVEIMRQIFEDEL